MMGEQLKKPPTIFIIFWDFKNANPYKGEILVMEKDILFTEG